MPHCERRAAVMAPPGTAMYFYIGEGSWGGLRFFTIYSSRPTRKMWEEEIARPGASCCLGSSTSPRRSRGRALSSVLRSRRTDDKAVDLRMTLRFCNSRSNRLSARDTPMPGAETARASRVRAISSSDRDVQPLVE